MYLCFVIYIYTYIYCTASIFLCVCEMRMGVELTSLQQLFDDDEVAAFYTYNLLFMNKLFMYVVVCSCRYWTIGPII